MRAAVVVLGLVSCTTTRVSVKGGELYDKLDELRTTGRADVAIETTTDDRAGEPGLATVELDQRVTHDGRARPLADWARGCTVHDEDGEAEVKFDGCYLAVYRDDRFVLKEREDLDLGLAGKTALAITGAAAYGVMANCIWNCDNKTHANMSLVGIGIFTVVSALFTIGRALD